VRLEQKSSEIVTRLVKCAQLHAFVGVGNIWQRAVTVSKEFSSLVADVGYAFSVQVRSCQRSDVQRRLCGWVDATAVADRTIRLQETFPVHHRRRARLV
jgi:hypothetical protein